MADTYDVIVVGAGLAGLQAAWDIQRAGLTCLVLEARDRVGGKTLTRKGTPGGEVQQDLGAAWINDTNQSRMWALARELGLHTYVQNTTGDVVVQDLDGSMITFPYGDVPQYPSAEETRQCVRIRDSVEATASNEGMFAQGKHRRWLDSMSFETWLHLTRAPEKARATAQVWTHAMIGVDPSEVSALYFLEYCKAGGGLMTMRSDGKDGGQYLRIREGTSAFAEGLAGKLKAGSIRLKSPVVAMTEEPAERSTSVTVNSPTPETFRARRVVLSIPTPVYKAITFSPPLPDKKRTIVNSTRYGFYAKYILAFKKPFWREKNLCGLAQSFTGPASVFRDTSIDDDGTYCLTGFIGGTFGRKWSLQDAEEKRDSILRQISSIFAGGSDISGLLVEALESPWMQEEWSGWGCPCPIMPPGLLADGWDTLCAPVGSVHFIGTELATVWRGYMEGAIRTGERGAAEVIAALKGTSSRL